MLRLTAGPPTHVTIGTEVVHVIVHPYRRLLSDDVSDVIHVIL